MVPGSRDAPEATVSWRFTPRAGRAIRLRAAGRPDARAGATLSEGFGKTGRSKSGGVECELGIFVLEYVCYEYRA